MTRRDVAKVPRNIRIRSVKAKDWWWLSFCDQRLPAGVQFQGVAIVPGASMSDAVSTAWRLGINPGGEVLGASMSDIDPESFRHHAARLLTREEAEAIGLGLRPKKR